jgi:LysR family transcriptional regulator, cyn operon transcriptional activator
MFVNLELYRVFYFTAKAGSFSGAANQLYISQPAVSQSIRQLEEKLGGKLFFRTPRGIVLTAEGDVMLKYIEQAYNFIVTAESKFAEMQNLVSGEIRIGASDTLCRHYLAPHLEQFHHRFPDVRIQVTNRTSPETIQLLKAGKVDLGLINLPVDGDRQLAVREVFAVQDCFVAGGKYRHLCERPLSLEELTRHPLLLLEKGSSTRRYLDQYAARLSVSIRPEIELGSIDLLVQFAKIGLGVAFVVKNFITEELAGGEICELPLQPELPARKVGIVTMRDVPLSAAGKKLSELLC